MGNSKQHSDSEAEKESLNQYRENLEIVFNNSSDNFVLLDSNARVVLFNKGFQRFAENNTGITPRSGMSLFEVVPASRRQANEENFRRVVQGERIHTIGQMNSKGETLYFDIRYNPVLRENKVAYVTLSALDITEQKKQEMMARHQAEILDIILNNTTDHFALTDTAGKLIFCNQAYAQSINKTLGITPTIGMHVSELVSPQRQAAAQNILDRVMGGETIDTIAEVSTLEGIRFFDLHVQAIKKDGVVKYIFRTAVDITERRVQEKIINDYKENLEIIFNNTNDHFVLIDASGNVISFNARFSEFIQQTLHTTPAVGMSYLDLVPTHRREIAKSIFVRALNGESVFTESEMVTSRGSEYFEFRYVPVFANGKVAHISFSAIDRTQKRKQELEITQYRQNLSIIFENSSDYFLLLDAKATVIFFNQKFSEFVSHTLNVRAKEGMTFMEVVAPGRRNFAQEIFEQTLNGVSNSSEAEFSTATGTMWLSIRYTPVFQAGKVTHVCSVATDITERKRQEIELREYRVSLERKVKERTEELNTALQQERQHVEMKNKFVSMASHEFRTPLATISLASEFVRKYRDRLGRETIDRKLETIEMQIDHMTSMLNDVLTIGKSDAGKVEVKWSTINVRCFFEALTQEVMNSTRGTHRINLQLDIPVGEFISDQGLIRNIFINLLNNAIKFSGDSRMIYFLVTSGERNLTAVVRDFGMGIPREDVPKLFEPFFRAGNVAHVGGTGLGLSIVKKALNALGGEISIETELGKGTAFQVTLPGATRKVRELIEFENQ